MNRGLLTLLLLGVTTSAFAQAMPEARIVTVSMLDKSTAQWRFEPDNITVRPGDTIRWVQDDIVPHNVEFKSVPSGADLGDAMLGPFLFTKGEAYELVVDERFADGTYEYSCTPHDPLGMKATLTVVR